MGRSRALDAPPDMPLLWALREPARTDRHQIRLRHRPMRVHARSHVDGEAVRSLPVAGRRGRRPDGHDDRSDRRHAGRCELAEGLAGARGGSVAATASSGQIMSAAALLAATPHPDDDDIDAPRWAGNICRCGTYVSHPPPAIKARGRVGKILMRRRFGDRLPMTRAPPRRR